MDGRDVETKADLLIRVGDDSLDFQVVVPQRLIARQRQAAQPSTGSGARVTGARCKDVKPCMYVRCTI
jgi:hypothetical protein